MTRAATGPTPIPGASPDGAFLIGVRNLPARIAPLSHSPARVLTSFAYTWRILPLLEPLLPDTEESKCDQLTAERLEYLERAAREQEGSDQRTRMLQQSKLIEQHQMFLEQYQDAAGPASRNRRDHHRRLVLAGGYNSVYVATRHLRVPVDDVLYTQLCAVYPALSHHSARTIAAAASAGMSGWPAIDQQLLLLGTIDEVLLHRRESVVLLTAILRQPQQRTNAILRALDQARLAGPAAERYATLIASGVPAVAAAAAAAV